MSLNPENGHPLRTMRHNSNSRFRTCYRMKTTETNPHSVCQLNPAECSRRQQVIFFTNNSMFCISVMKMMPLQHRNKHNGLLTTSIILQKCGARGTSCESLRPLLGILFLLLLLHRAGVSGFRVLDWRMEGDLLWSLILSLGWKLRPASYI